MRLIDADELKETFDVAFFNDEDDYKKALRIIDNVPTVEERPQGEWIYSHDTFSKRICNKCNYSQIIVDGMSDNFCPNCGAEMVGGES